MAELHGVDADHGWSHAFSENGAADTTIGGSFLLDSVNVIIGRMREGFTINAPVTVGAGVDASAIHIN
jgi:hypothetical protein